MTTRSETRDTKQREQFAGQQAVDAQQTGRAGSGEVRSDRERGLQTGREGRTQSGLVRSGKPGSGLVSGAQMRSPFALMRRVMDDMDRAFEEFGFGRDVGFGRSLVSPLWGGADNDLWVDLSTGGDALWSPAVEVLERGDKLVVRAEIPGVSKDDVNVNVTDDALTIEGERRREAEDRGEGFYRSERSYGRFLRTIPLPDGVDAEKIEATFKDGVLELTLPAPKREQKRGRKISIR